jgi:hypothetical protein
MARTPIFPIRLDAEHREMLDTLARARSVSSAEVIKQLIEEASGHITRPPALAEKKSSVFDRYPALRAAQERQEQQERVIPPPPTPGIQPRRRNPFDTRPVEQPEGAVFRERSEL